MKTSYQLKRRIALIAAGLLSFGSMVVPVAANATGTLTNRSATLSNAAKSGTSTYTLTMTGASATTIKSIQVSACTTAFGSCTAVSGFNWNAASSPSTTNNSFGATATNWVIGTCPAQTANVINYTYSANAASGNTADSAMAFAGVTNPSTSNTAYYLRIQTYSAANCATPLDTGNVTFAVTDTVQVQGTVQETLTFCVYTATCGGGVVNPVSLATGTNCGTALQTANICNGTSAFDLATNANSGAIVYSTATAFTNQNSPGNSFSVLGTDQTSTVGTEQFGMQCAGAGLTFTSATCSTAGASKYSYTTTANSQLASVAGPTGTLTGTVTYGANIALTSKPGVYQGTMLYSVVAKY